MKLRAIKSVKSLRGKRVLVRVDFNVPLAKDGSVADDFKIRAALPTIEFLAKRGARVVIASHLGRPKRQEAALRMNPVAAHLSRLLGRPVRLAGDCIGPIASRAVAALAPGEILLLENLRFHSGEEKNETSFAKALARHADIFVNDGFGVCHRPAASVVGVTKFLQSYAGLLIEKEVAALSRLLTKPKRPFVAILGGAKISTKINLIRQLLPRVDVLMLGGALVHPIFHSWGWEVGKSMLERHTANLNFGIPAMKIQNPVDVVVLDRHGRAAVRPANAVQRADTIMDIGPETIRHYAAIIRMARTVVWNGPLGAFEDRRFSHGTIALGRFIASRSRGRAFGVAGGGETVEAIRRTGMMEHLDWISTGGGAMLEYIEGKTLPGLKPLMR